MSTNEIKSWLKKVLKDENIDDFYVEITGNSEKGDGYVGDIVFVSLKPKNGGTNKNYHLVLKCSKRSEALRKSTPVQNAFLNEIYIYDKVFPAFTKFQREKGIVKVFNSFPKCYGTLILENMEIIVFENLKANGYTLWEKKKPLTRKHLDLVLTEYAKYHAISIAMKEQRPEEFEKLTKGLQNVFEQFFNKTNMISFLQGSIDDVYNVLQGDLDEEILNKFRTLKDKVNHILKSANEGDGLKVIRHGDCWSNNFMFKNLDNNVLLPSKVSILDWQIAQYSSPILDLSYFLFASISRDDIGSLTEILRNYYEKFSDNVKALGSNLEIIYSVDDFFNDWRKKCHFGIILSTLLHKICATEKDEIIDITESAEKGEDFTKTFQYEVKDKNCFKNRSRHVVKYVVENNLV